ncbi:MAG: hypothetical protein WED34_03105 [Planctomycetales bacterium]
MSTKDEAARKLADVHYHIEPGIIRIFKLEESPEFEELSNTPIKLLEINTETVPSGIMPLHFGPAPASGIPFPSVIVEITPDEFEQLESQRLSLPAGWTIAEELPKGG